MNIAASLAILPALGLALSRANDHPLSLWLFVVFIFLVRLKVFFDDHQYFEKPETEKRHFKVGFLVGVFSWVLWIAGAGQVDRVRHAYVLVGAALAISTLWIIVVEIGKTGRGRGRLPLLWAGTNIVFLALVTFAFLRNRPVGDWPTWAVLLGCLVVALFDLFKGNSLPDPAV